jgi:hypothetical protein
MIIHSHTKNQVNISKHNKNRYAEQSVVILSLLLRDLEKGETFASLLNIHGRDICVVPTHLVFTRIYAQIIFDLTLALIIINPRVTVLCSTV